MDRIGRQIVQTRVLWFWIELFRLFIVRCRILRCWDRHLAMGGVDLVVALAGYLLLGTVQAAL